LNVNILIEGTTQGTVSSQSGDFRINVSGFPVFLIFSSVGYERRRIEFRQADQGIIIILDPSTLEGETVFVEGGRIVSPADERSTIPITSLLARDLVLKQNTTAADLLRSEAGVYVQQTTPGQGSIYVRGRAGRDVLYLFNGLRMNPSFVRSGQNQYFGVVDPFSVERLDVFRGPISTFYGSDALTGGVNIQPEMSRLTDESAWKYGLKSQVNLGGSGEKSLHAEFGNNGSRFSWMTSGTLRYFEYYQMSPNNQDRLWFPYNSRLEDGDFSFQAINSSLSWQFSSRSRLQAVLYHGVIPKAPRWDRMMIGYSESGSPARYYDSNTYPLAFSAAQVEWNHSTPIQWLKSVKVHLGYHRLKDYRRSISFERAPLWNSPSLIGIPRQEALHDNSISDQLHLSVDLRSLVNKDILLRWGGDLSYDLTSSEHFLLSNFENKRTNILPRFPDGSTYLQSGVFAHLSHYGLGRMQVEGGLRFSSVYAQLPMEGLESERGFDPYSKWFSQLTASTGASYKMGKKIYVLANLGSGFRAPNIADLSELGIRRSNVYQIANPDLKPEQSVNVDLGLRYRSDKIDTEWSVFLINYFNKISNQFTGNVVDARGRRVETQDTPQAGNDLYFEAISTNADSKYLNGVEARFRYTFVKGVDAGFITNVMYGRVRGSDGVRDYIDRLPPTNGLFFAEVRTFNNRLILRPQGRFALTKSTLAIEELSDNRINPDGTDGFVNLQFISTFQLNKDLELRLFGDNLSNQTYREHGSSLNGMARNVTISLNYAF
jgi:outer membrane receptor protein involved in Fe transport